MLASLQVEFAYAATMKGRHAAAILEIKLLRLKGAMTRAGFENNGVVARRGGCRRTEKGDDTGPLVSKELLVSTLSLSGK